MNEETVEQAIRRHERWLAEQETPFSSTPVPSLNTMRRFGKMMWREVLAALRAATERADRMDKRLERFEREGRRRLGNQEERLKLHQEQVRLHHERPPAYDWRQSQLWALSIPDRRFHKLRGWKGSCSEGLGNLRATLCNRLIQCGFSFCLLTPESGS